MKIKLWKKKKRERTDDWFAWYPVIAEDKNEVRYIVWLMTVFRYREFNFTNYYIYDRYHRYG